MKPVAHEPLEGVGIEGILVLVEGVGKEAHGGADDGVDATASARGRSSIVMP
jgi:hypothetical protein